MFLVAGAGPAICTQTPAENLQKHNCPATLTTTKQKTTTTKQQQQRREKRERCGDRQPAKTEHISNKAFCKIWHPNTWKLEIPLNHVGQSRWTVTMDTMPSESDRWQYRPTSREPDAGCRLQHHKMRRVVLRIFVHSVANNSLVHQSPWFSFVAVNGHAVQEEFKYV